MTDKEKNNLWIEYNNTHSQEIREKIILEYAPLVKIIAGKLSMYLNYMVELDDLCSYGVFGLIDAVDKFKLSKDVKFETYASLRIRGSIIDNIRKMDWIPRTVREKQKELNGTISNLQNKLGREPSDEEIMHELGLSEDDYYKQVGQANISAIISIDAETEDSDNIANTLKQNTFEIPEESILKDELNKKLSEAIKELSDKEQKVILLYYYEELTLKEIANILEVSESRVSQLHTKAIQKMKKILGNYTGMLTSSII